MRVEHAGLVLDTTYAIGYCPPYGRGFGTDSTLSHMCERFPIQKKILLLLLIILLSCMILGPLESTSEEMY